MVCTTASRDNWVSLGWCQLIQEYFCAGMHAEKAELSKCSWPPKRNFGVAMHFSEILIKQASSLIPASRSFQSLITELSFTECK